MEEKKVKKYKELHWMDINYLQTMVFMIRNPFYPNSNF